MAAKKVLTGECIYLIRRRSRRGRVVSNRILPCFKPGRDYTVRGLATVTACLCRRHARQLQRRVFSVEVAR